MKRFVIILILVLIAVPCVLGSMTYSGFCLAEARYLSDEEKFQLVAQSIVDIMVSRSARLQYISLPSDGGYIDYPDSRIIPYRSPRDFLDANKNCCRMMEPEGFEHQYTASQTFVRRILGEISEYAIVRYQFRFVDAQGVEHAFARTIKVGVSACGKPKWGDE